MELMVVSAIISILAAISFALLSRMQSQMIETNALAALNTMATGYEMYKFVNSSYPQWGDGQKFSSPEAIIDDLISEEFLPRSYRSYDVEPGTGYLFGMFRDYAVEIPQYTFNPLDPATSPENSYFIVFHPYNFQRDALAIGNDPPNGWIAVRARRGYEGGDFRRYSLFTFKRME